MMNAFNDKIIAIVGPTAAGKTSLGISLAKAFDGEIVSIDSRTAYRGLDIGTAKPSLGQRKDVPHHLLDILDPGETITAAQFKQLAWETISDIRSRAKLPVLVGGSGLYMDAILFDYRFPGPADQKNREELASLSLQALRNKLRQIDSVLYGEIDTYNKRRLIRAIETAGQTKTRKSGLIRDCLCLGLTMSNEVARERIRLRLEQMVHDGLLREVEVIGDTYGYDCPALEVTGYCSIKKVVFGETTLEDGMREAENETMAVYKKQVTWFKRNKAIKWVSGFDEAKEFVGDFLKGKV
jgi:tRNA dimethylallyltransferase